MADLFYDLTIRARREHVFELVSTPAGLNAWWTLDCAGLPAAGQRYTFDFGPGYRWQGEVVACETPRLVEWVFKDADPDWLGTCLRIALFIGDHEGYTTVRFAHTGWPSRNAHCRVSSYCWAMYLRQLKRVAEHHRPVPYEQRLDD